MWGLLRLAHHNEHTLTTHTLTICTHAYTHINHSNRDMPISKLEKLFEAETLSERDSYDIGSDDSTQAPALARIRGSRKSRRESVKVGARESVKVGE